MSGAVTPASSIRRLISGTACAASGTFTVTRTISEPAWASSIDCRAVEATSAVSVLAIDWTTTGAPPPTRTGPTRTPTVACLFLLSIGPFNLPDPSEGQPALASHPVRHLLQVHNLELFPAQGVAQSPFDLDDTRG